MKDSDRTIFWQRQCQYSEINAASIERRRGYGTDLAGYIESLKKLANIAEAEGFDDSATYLRHIVDDLENMQ